MNQTTTIPLLAYSEVTGIWKNLKDEKCFLNKLWGKTTITRRTVMAFPQSKKQLHVASSGATAHELYRLCRPLRSTMNSGIKNSS